MTMPTFLPEVITGVMLLIATITDVTKRKIYNWLTFPAFFVGIVLNVVMSGGKGLLFSLEGIAVGSIWVLLVILRSATGMGDLKLFLAVGAIMGPKFTLWTLLCSAIAGGVMGVFYALRRGVLGHTVKNALLGVHVLATVQSPDSLKSMASESKAGKMPSAPSIAVGAAIAWWLIMRHLV